MSVPKYAKPRSRSLSRARLLRFIVGVLSVLAVIIVACVVYFCQSQEETVGWHSTPNGRRYRVEANGEWVTGFLVLDGNTYLFSEDGFLCTGLVELDGKTYYFDKQGVMQTGWVQPDTDTRYFLDANGVAVTGWFNDSGKTYFATDNGAVCTGWFKQDAKQYYADETGALCKGWLTLKEKYLFDIDGVMQTGWVEHEGLRYCLDENGVLLTGKRTVDNEEYDFGEDGALRSGWFTYKNATYFADDHGFRAVGWKRINNTRYHFSETGALSVNTTVSGVAIGADGKVSEKDFFNKEPDFETDNLGERLDALLDKYGRTHLGIFKAVRASLSYKQVADQETPEEMALYALRYSRGACYHYASLQYLLCKRAGLNVVYVHGKGPWGEHHWVIGEFDDGWWIVDSCYSDRYRLPASGMQNKGYSWKTGMYPQVQ